MSDELIAEYLRTATVGREWFLSFCSSGYVQRWHAKCIAHSDFAAIRGKNQPAHDRHLCACGKAVENTQHVHLDCELYSILRRPFFAAIDTWLDKVRETESSATGWEHMDRVEAMQWIHHDTPLVTNPITALAGAQVRQAALSLHSKIQQERYATGRIHRATRPFFD